MTKHSYTRNGQPISETDALDDHGILRDGCTVHVAARFRDNAMINRRPVYDAFGHPAGYRPGFVFTNDQAARDAKAAAYRQYDEEIGRAWQQTNPRSKSEVATGAGERRQGGGDWLACPDCNGHDATCSTCNGRGFVSRDDARDDAALEAAFQQTQTYHEGGRRLDAMMRDHQSNMRHVYAAYDRDLTESWRRS
jgi:hypothetical protein